MATKALNYTTAEINQRLNLAGTAVQPSVLENYYTKTEVDGKVVVDLSARYSASYANLSAALTALNADTSATAIKVGGMSIKFINSSTNKYEQWNLKASSWSTNTFDWALDVDGSVANGKLKLPFELEKPSSNEYVTQASEIGYGDSNVVDEIHRIYDILGSELTITAFSNDGRLKDDGTIVTHSDAKTSDYILLDNKTIKQIKCCFRPTESDVNYCGVAFYSQNNESSFISCIRDTTGGTNVGGGWYLCTYNYVSIPEGAHYMRVTANPGITQEGKITLVTAQLQDETPTRNSLNGVKSGGVYDAIYGDRGSKQFFTLDNDSKIDGNNVVLAGYNFVYAQINGTTHRYTMTSGTYTLSGGNKILYVIPSLNPENITPQVASIGASQEILDTKNIIIIAYTNGDGKLFFNTTNIRLSDIMESVNGKFSTLEGRFSLINKIIATVDNWSNYAYNADGTVSSYGGYHAEVTWDASRPKMKVLLNWAIQGGVRYIVFKDANDTVISSISYGAVQYPIIIEVPAGTSKLLVSKYNPNNSPEGNEICQINMASNGSLGLIDKSSSEIITEANRDAKINILGTRDVDITSFQYDGRIKADGTDGIHGNCKRTGYVPLNDRLIKTINVCFIPTESNVDYCAVAFYGQDNEESFISCIRSTTGGTQVVGAWKAVTYNDVPIPEGAHYMRVTNNMSLYPNPEIEVTEFNKIPEPVYEEVYTDKKFFTYDVDCGIDDIEDALQSTNVQGLTSMGTDQGLIMFASNYSATGLPTPLVIFNHGAGGQVTNNSAEGMNGKLVLLLTKKGYNVLFINGVPSTLRNTKYMSAAYNGAAAHMGGWVFQRSAISAYNYVTSKYNIAKDGCAIIGGSMGGLSSLNLAMLGSIPVKVLALDAPVIDAYHDAYFSGNWSGGTLGGKTPPIFAWIYQWDYCDFTNDTYTIPVGTYTIHGDTYTIDTATAKSLADLNTGNKEDMAIMWYLNQNKMMGYNAYKTGNFLIRNLDSSYFYTRITDNEDVYYGKKLPAPCKIWFGSGDTTNQIDIARRFVRLSRNGGSVIELRTAPSNAHTVWGVTKALDGTTDISVTEDGIECSPYCVEALEWIMRYLPNVQ